MFTVFGFYKFQKIINMNDLKIIQSHPRTLNKYNVDLQSLKSPCPLYIAARGAIENI